MKHLLFLCTGNSCRSQMAEAFAKRHAAADIQVHSAGIEKHGLNPHMLRVMEEAGVDMQGHHSKTIDELPDEPWDLVVTVCSHAREQCPFLPAKQHLHVPFDDPPALTREMTSPGEILAVYRRVRDEIEQAMTSLVEQLKEKSIHE